MPGMNPRYIGWGGRVVWGDRGDWGDGGDCVLAPAEMTASARQAGAMKRMDAIYDARKTSGPGEHPSPLV